MAKEVTLKELNDWIQKNLHRTWFRGQKPGSLEDWTMEMKYIRFNLDTRDMKIFSLTTRGLGKEITVDFRDDDKDWTILELLESRLEGK